MMMKKTLSAFLIAIIFLPPNMWADQFETRNGKKYEGKILTEDTQGLFLETSEGMINLPKMNLLTVNGEPYHYAGKATAFVDPSKAPAQPVYVGQMSTADQDAGAAEQGKNIGVPFVAPEQLGQPPVVAAEATAPAGTVPPMIHSVVSEEELEKYYQRHPEEFRMPVQLKLKYINNAVLEQFKLQPEAILKNPAASTAWQDAGWIKEGDTTNAPLTNEAYQQIFRLRQGEACLVRDTNGLPYLFWAGERKEAYYMPYAEARPKVLTQVLKTRQ